MKQLMRLCLIPIVCFFANFSATAQVQTARNVSMISNSKAYWEYLPEGYGSGNETYPLMLCLHGVGSIGDGSAAQLPHALDGLPGNWIRSHSFPKSFTVNGQTFKFIVITPQFTNWPNPDNINKILDYIIAHYRVNINRIYLTGLSMGGGVTWDYAASTYGKRLAAIVPVCGASNLGLTKSRVIAAENLPVWATHNDGDPTVPCYYTNNNIAYINQSPAPNPLARKTIFHAAVHDAWYKTYNPSYKENGMNVYEWMLQYQKGGNTAPSSNVTPIVNQLPKANAGSNETITLPVNIAALTGSGTDADGTITAYTWSKISGPAGGVIANTTVAQTTATGLTQGTYAFELKVTDNRGATAKDTVTVIVKAANRVNQLPVVNAGADRVINLPTSSLTLSGSATDTDGKIVSYLWTKISGPVSYRIESPAATQTGVYSLTQGTYLFELKATDNDGAIGKDSVLVTVNAAPNKAPKVNAGGDRSLTLPTSSLTLLGSGSDEDGKIVSYKWSKISGPGKYNIPDAAIAHAAIYGLEEGTYAFRLTVTDNDGATASDDVVVTVDAAPNTAPVANAGMDQTIQLPVNNITIKGSGTDNDGNITAYAWIKIAGPSEGTIANANNAQTNVTGLVQGIYEFELKVTDNGGSSAKDTIRIIVKAANQSPVANGGNDITITLPVNTINLSGSATDLDGTITSYYWTKISGPSTGNFTTPNKATTTMTGLMQGIYELALTVTDNQGATGKDTLRVTVNAPLPLPNKRPVVSAGADHIITLPANSITLTGSANDSDGTIASYQWKKIAGPNSYKIINVNTAQTQITDLIGGIYQFELTATDNGGAIVKDTVQVTVNAAPNKAPIASAGMDQSIQLPDNTITLNGSGSDADGTIVSYIWTKISGPAAGSMDDATDPKTKVKGLAQGTYIYELRVTDNGRLSATDTVHIIVKAAPNTAPKAYAGSDIAITLPVNTVTLSGTGSDEDGTIATYRWSKISGTSSYTIVSATTASTIINDLTAGVYQFTLTVKDNQGATSIDTVQVTVNNASHVNQLPTVNAGANQSVTLPINSVMLNGNATDSDGRIISTVWSKISGPQQYTIANRDQLQTGVTNLVQGIYYFQLKATDNDSAVAMDTVQITINRTLNKRPTVRAGNNQSITLPVNNVVLGGSANDSDGVIVSYLWKKISGPSTYTIASDNKAQTAVNNLTTGIYAFELSVMDNDGAIAKDTVQITVNKAPNQLPLAKAGAAQTIQLPNNKVTLNGSGTDIDGTIVSYEWTKISGPKTYTITNAKAAQTTVTNLTTGTYAFVLTVTDNEGAAATDTIQVIVKAQPANQLPEANAGQDITITLPVNSIVLKGNGTDKDGSIAQYQWTKIAGPAAGTIASTAKAETTVTGLMQGVYLFQLQVTDDRGGVAADTIQVVVNPAPNKAPMVDAGAGQTIALPVNTVVLNGNGTDEDGTIVTYRWIKVSGPLQGTIVDANKAQAIVTGLAEGIYRFELKVTDNDSATAAATVQIVVNAAPNVAPVANAGADQTITLPVNSVTLAGSGTDADGTINTYHWQNLSDQPTVAITDAGNAQTTVTGLMQGSYLFELSVTDNKGAIAKDTVQITVKEAPVNNIELSAYPNPVVNELNINVQAPLKMTTNTKVRIMDIGGNIVYQEEYVRGESKESKKINVQHLRSGVYFVEVSVGFTKKTMKIIKN